MAEEVVQKEVVQEPVALVEEQPKPEVDLVTRVSQIKNEAKKTEEEGKFNINDLDSEIEKLPDPKLKEQVLGLKKSLLKGENQKYQEIANLRKDYEKKLADVSNWTPERLQAEMSKPDFVQAAQTVLQSNNKHGLSNDEWSSLSDSEKAELTQLKQKIASLEQNNWQAVKSSQDVQLKTKYANYDPDAIDRLTEELMQGKLKATREHLHKVLDYDNAVKRAYELGLMDKQSQNQEKVKGMSFEGGRNISTPSTIERQKGESVENFMRRSYQERSKQK